MTEYMLIPEAVKHDRTQRRQMSRRVYAETVGITEGRVHALENKRRLKPGELAALAPFIRDLIDPAMVASIDDSGTTVPPANPNAPVVPPTTPTPQPEPDPDIIRFEAVRQQMGNQYLDVMRRLGTRIPPYPWPSQFRLETAPPIDFEVIQGWIENVRGWCDEQDGVGAPVPDAAQWNGEDGDEDESWYDPATTEPVNEPTPLTPPPTAGPLPAPELVNLEPGMWYLTNGEVSTFLDCERRWLLQNYYQLGPQTEKHTGAAAIGTRFHAALAVWYQPEPGDPWEQFNADTAERLSYLQDAEVDEETIKSFHSDTDLVRAMLEGYFDWISTESIDAGLKIVGPEMVVTADPQFPGHPNVRLLAKLDVRVIQEIDNSRMFLDHKTVGNFIEPMKTLQMNPQMLHYHLIEYLDIVAAGLDRDMRAAGALYNMARKVKRTAAANPPFYMREQIKYNNDQLQSYWLKLKGVVEKITAVRAALDGGADHREMAPPRPSDSCSWKCEFYAVCPMMDHSPQGAAVMLQEQFIRVNPLRRYEPDAVGATM